MTIRIIQGDCREVMKALEEHSVDAIVTDPPYELGFMGKGWDKSGVAFDSATWREALRVLKPGGHLLAFGGTRTYHRMACAVEDAGFEIRDQIGWLFGSGFPKSHNLGGEWAGWGTALKPAWEPIVLARKPLSGTVAANVLAHGTGALNIDGCRIETDPGDPNRRDNPSVDRQAWKHGGPSAGYGHTQEQRRPTLQQGRWPANLIHDGSEEVLAAFPQAPGQQSRVTGTEQRKAAVYGAFSGVAAAAPRGDAGSAARFFYSAKASAHDRHDGMTAQGPQFTQGRMSHDAESVERSRRGNHHPTVKPTGLMQYLCRLVTPPCGVVLDPFCGSGSTLKAAELEGLSAIGIELDPEYIQIARRRIAADMPLFADSKQAAA